MILGMGAVLLLSGCDPMAVRPTPAVIVVTHTATAPPTVPPQTPTPSATRTPPPTLTPDVSATPTPFPCEGDGLVVEVALDSDSTGETLPYTLYLPPCYGETALRYPLLLLLPDADADETQWTELGLADTLDRGTRLGVLPPMVVAMPALGNIGLRDQFPPDPSYETLLIDELLPELESNLCLWEDRTQRAIGGIGRGGFWAMSLAMRQPDLFSAAGSHSGIYTENLDLVPPPFNPLDIARNSTLLPGADLRLYLDNAAGDNLAAAQQLLSDRMTARQVRHTYIINPVGGHDSAYWSSQLSAYLSFYGEAWPRTYSGLPTCLEPSP